MTYEQIDAQLEMKITLENVLFYDSLSMLYECWLYEFLSLETHDSAIRLSNLIA